MEKPYQKPRTSSINIIRTLLRRMEWFINGLSNFVVKPGESAPKRLKYLKKGKTVTGAYYAALLDRLVDEVSKKRPHLKKTIFFHNDNASKDSCMVVVLCRTKKLNGKQKGIFRVICQLIKIFSIFFPGFCPGVKHGTK